MKMIKIKRIANMFNIRKFQGVNKKPEDKPNDKYRVIQPMLKNMVIRDENGLEQLKYPLPIFLDIHEMY